MLSSPINFQACASSGDAFANTLKADSVSPIAAYCFPRTEHSLTNVEGYEYY